MTYVIVAVLSSLGTVAALYAWLKYNEWRWDRDDAFWDHE